MKKLITAAQAASMLKDDMTLAVSGFSGYAAPETLLKALSERYEGEKSPNGLTVAAVVSPGDGTTGDVGMNRIAKEGLVGTIIASHVAIPPLFARLIDEEKAAGYTIPLGVLIHLFDATAAGESSFVTKVGLGTYADPDFEGCRSNEKAVGQGRTIVDKVSIAGEDRLSYRTFPIDICFIRAEYADENGNIAAADDALGDCCFDIAAATHNSGGIVIAEVKDIVKAHTLHPKQVIVHSPMVNYVVKADPDLYVQGYAAKFRPELCGDTRVPVESIDPMPMSSRKIIARRAAMELKPNCMINLGIGIPSGIGSVANEEGINAMLSVEAGPQGGVPLEGAAFSASVNPDIIYPLANIFHLYDGGLLDMTFLGAAEIDSEGNVNVTKFNGKTTGPGGFIDISQNTPKVCFVGTFTVGGLKETVEDGRLGILQEGKYAKFVGQVQQISFSGKYAREHGQKVKYVTERAVFELREDGMTLTEIAPGVDLEKDVLAHMGFRPLIAEDLKEMDPRIFREGKMFTE
ncbi:MAG: CoA-transferase [Anaerovoracaceae bacterium]|nr:CoA-transferase [Anaerovoracaceae bacterium]